VTVSDLSVWNVGALLGTASRAGRSCCLSGRTTPTGVASSALQSRG